MNYHLVILINLISPSNLKSPFHFVNEIIERNKLEAN